MIKNLEDFSHFAEIISALSAFAILIITVCANKTINKISEYSNSQIDRNIIEKIFSIQEEAYSIFLKCADFKDLEPTKKLVRARELAKLYGLLHIEQNIDKIIELLTEGCTIYHQIWDNNGNYKDTTNLNKHQELVKRAISYFCDIKCYQNYLMIKYHK